MHLFVFRLALALGMTVSELVKKMSVSEFLGWAAYYEIEPWGARLEGIRLASINSSIYNAGLMVANPKKLRSKPFTPDQFYVGVSMDQRSNLKQVSWKAKRKIYDKIFGEAKSCVLLFAICWLL